MPIPRVVARVNRVATNRVIKPFAAWVPGFGVILHRGRRSGRLYRTPVNVFRRSNGYVVALTYGANADWVKNVLAANGCVLQTRRQRIRLVDPLIVRDRARGEAPPVIRQILGLLDVADFLHLAVGSASAEQADGSGRSDRSDAPSRGGGT